MTLSRYCFVQLNCRYCLEQLARYVYLDNVVITEIAVPSVRFSGKQLSHSTVCDRSFSYQTNVYRIELNHSLSGILNVIAISSAIPSLCRKYTNGRSTSTLFAIRSPLVFPYLWPRRKTIFYVRQYRPNFDSRDKK
jgi:hypothetical protein